MGDELRGDNLVHLNVNFSSETETAGDRLQSYQKNRKISQKAKSVKFAGKLYAVRV